MPPPMRTTRHPGSLARLIHARRVDLLKSQRQVSEDSWTEDQRIGISLNHYQAIETGRACNLRYTTRRALEYGLELESGSIDDAINDGPLTPRRQVPTEGTPSAEQTREEARRDFGRELLRMLLTSNGRESFLDDVQIVLRESLVTDQR